MVPPGGAVVVVEVVVDELHAASSTPSATRPAASRGAALRCGRVVVCPGVPTSTGGLTSMFAVPGYVYRPRSGAHDASTSDRIHRRGTPGQSAVNEVRTSGALAMNSPARDASGTALPIGLLTRGGIAPRCRRGIHVRFSCCSLRSV